MVQSEKNRPLSQSIAQVFCKFLGTFEKRMYLCEQIAMDMNREQIIQLVSQTALRNAPQGTEVILYGSQARGDMREDSDWDVLVLLDKDRVSLDDIDNIGYHIRELGWEIGEDINPVLYTKKEWERYAYTPFYKNVKAEGIRI